MNKQIAANLYDDIKSTPLYYAETNGIKVSGFHPTIEECVNEVERIKQIPSDLLFEMYTVKEYNPQDRELSELISQLKDEYGSLKKHETLKLMLSNWILYQLDTSTPTFDEFLSTSTSIRLMKSVDLHKGECSVWLMSV